MLKAIYAFMAFSILLCVMGVSSEVYRASLTNAPLPYPDPEPSTMTSLSNMEQVHALEVCTKFLAALDDGDLQSAYGFSSDMVKTRVPFETFKNQLRLHRDPFGRPSNRFLDQTYKAKALVDDKTVTVYVVRYRVSFSNFPNSMEEVRLTMTDDGKFMPFYYQVL